MYTTIQAKIERGHIIPLEPNALPENATALITIVKEMDNQEKKDKINRVESLLNKLKINLLEDPASWQKRIRDEWT